MLGTLVTPIMESIPPSAAELAHDLERRGEAVWTESVVVVVLISLVL